MSHPKKVALLSQVAFKTFRNDQYFLPKRTLEEYISQYIEKLKRNPFIR